MKVADLNITLNLKDEDYNHKMELAAKTSKAVREGAQKIIRLPVDTRNITLMQEHILT